MQMKQNRFTKTQTGTIIDQYHIYSRISATETTNKNAITATATAISLGMVMLLLLLMVMA